MVRFAHSERVIEVLPVRLSWSNMKRITEKELALRVGQNISKHRKAKKMTSEGLAFEIDSSKGYMSDIENGNRLPSLPMLIQIANTLEIDISDLVK